MVLRFCPACGGKLLPASVVKYCAFCGESLDRLTANDTETSAPVLIADSQETAADPISRQTACTLDPYYSIILKSGGNKERLINRLSEVLLRGVFATRMAVDMVPSVLVYKSKEKDIEAIIAIINDEHAHYAVIQGDFALNAPLEKTFSGIHGMSNEQVRILQNVPAALWLGEAICRVVSDIYIDEEPGMLVMTDRALYSISSAMNTQDLERLIIPYTHLSEAILHHDQDQLELVYKGHQQERWLRFANTEELAQVYAHLQLALKGAS